MHEQPYVYKIKTVPGEGKGEVIKGKNLVRSYIHMKLFIVKSGQDHVKPWL